MTGMKALALQIAVLKVIADEVTARLGVLKDQAKDAFGENGASQAHSLLPDGTKVASVSLNGGGKSAVVISDRDFLEWVTANHPGEIRSVVRESYRKKLLDACKAAGRPVDPETGEVVPGIAITPKTPYVSVRFATGGKDAVVRAWQDGTLSEIPLVEPAAIGAGQ